MFEAPSDVDMRVPSTFVGGAVIQSYISVAIMALVVYDHIITLPDEISYMWERSPTTATFLFALNRYIVLGYGIINFFSDYRAGCNALIRANQVISILLMVLCGVCSALRVYALAPWPVSTSLLVFCKNMIQVGLNIYFFAVSTSVTTNLNVAGCMSILSLSGRKRNNMIVAARVPTILSDALVLAVTLRRTWRVYSNARRARLRAPFAEILIRDGTVYFLASLIMNVAEVLVCNVLGQVYLLPFICSVTGILFTRLFFDLRALADAERACPRGLSELETPEFRMATTCHADTSWVLASSAGDYETEPRVDLV